MNVPSVAMIRPAVAEFPYLNLWCSSLAEPPLPLYWRQYFLTASFIQFKSFHSIKQNVIHNYSLKLVMISFNTLISFAPPTRENSLFRTSPHDIKIHFILSFFLFTHAWLALSKPPVSLLQDQPSISQGNGNHLRPSTKMLRPHSQTRIAQKRSPGGLASAVQEIRSPNRITMYAGESKLVGWGNGKYC